MSRRSTAIALATVVLGASIATPAWANALNANPEAAPEGTAQRVTGLVIASAGLIGFATGVFVGRDRAKRDDSSATCSVDVCQSMASLLIEDARAQNNTAFRLMSVGALAMVGGVFLYLTAPKHEGRRAQPTAGVALGPGGLVFRTSF